MARMCWRTFAVWLVLKGFFLKPFKRPKTPTLLKYAYRLMSVFFFNLSFTEFVMSNQNQNPAHLVAEQLNTHTTIVLKFPIKNGLGETMSELKMRRAKVGDLRTVGQMKNEMEQELALFARLTGLVPEDLDLLDTADYKQIQDAFRKFSE